jgi:hypothetical protein
VTSCACPRGLCTTHQDGPCPALGRTLLPTTLGTHSRRLPLCPDCTPATISLQPPQPLLTLLDTFLRLLDLLVRFQARYRLLGHTIAISWIGFRSSSEFQSYHQFGIPFSFTHVCLVSPPVLPRSYSPFAYRLLCLCATLLISVVTPHCLSFSPNPVLSLALRIP